MRDEFSAKKLAIISGLFYSLASITDKIAVSNSNPVWIGFFRMVSGSVFLLLIMIYRKEDFSLSKKYFNKLFIISIFYGFGTIFFINSIKLAGISVAVPIISIDIIFSAIIAFIFLNETKNKKLIFGIITAFLGILILYYGQNSIAIVSGWKIGIMFALSAALFWSIAQNLLKILLNTNISPLKTSFYVNLFGLPIILIFSFLYPFQIDINSLISISTSGLLIALAGLFLVIALSRGNVSKVIPMYGAIQPLIGVFLGFIIFSENISLITFIGILLISTSILIINKIK